MADDRDPIPIERDSVEFGRAIGYFVGKWSSARIAALHQGDEVSA